MSFYIYFLRHKSRAKAKRIMRKIRHQRAWPGTRGMDRKYPGGPRVWTPTRRKALKVAKLYRNRVRRWEAWRNALPLEQRPGGRRDGEFPVASPKRSEQRWRWIRKGGV